MKVWIVQGMEESIYAVFDSEDKATYYARNYHKNNPGSLPLDLSDFDISEFTVE